MKYLLSHLWRKNSANMLKNLSVCMEDNGNIVEVGNSNKVLGSLHIDCIESRKVTIGDDGLFSSHITLRTGDSHSVINMVSGLRINPSKDICLGNYVWCGQNVTGECNIAIAGNPARIVKRDVSWDIKRLKNYESSTN